jgi:hypothetical protein
MKCSDTEPSQATGFEGMCGWRQPDRTVPPGTPSSLADGAFSIAVLHLTKSAQSGLKIPQTDGIPSMCSTYLTCDWRALQ